MTPYVTTVSKSYRRRTFLHIAFVVAAALLLGSMTTGGLRLIVQLSFLPIAVLLSLRCYMIFILKSPLVADITGIRLFAFGPTLIRWSEVAGIAGTGDVVTLNVTRKGKETTFDLPMNMIAEPADAVRHELNSRFSERA